MALSSANLDAQVTIRGREAVITAGTEAAEKAVSVVRQVPGVVAVSSSRGDGSGQTDDPGIRDTSTSTSPLGSPSPKSSPRPSPSPSGSPSPKPVPKQEPILFVGGSASVTPAGVSRVVRLADLLLERPELSVTLTGHTDNGKTPAERQALGLKRARTIAADLKERGVPANRVKVESRGGRDPVADNTTAEGRAKNRRVEVTLEVVG